jgi:hypothetical protein
MKFEQETQVRSIIADILGPLVDRSHTNQTETRELSRVMDKLHKKVDELDRTVKNDLNLKQFLTDIKKRQQLIVSFSS